MSWQVKESRRSARQQRRQEREVEAKEKESFVSSLTSGLEPPPFDLLQPERTLRVPQACLGLVLGKKGANLKATEEKLQVKVKVQTPDDGSDSLVTISGAAAKVADAARELDFAFQRVEVSEAMAGWLRSKARTLKTIREMTGVPVLSLHDEGNWVDIKGLRNEVETAGLCLEAHMSYHSVFAEMEEVEKDLDRRIAEAKLRGSRRPLPCQAAKHGRTPPSAREVAKAAKASLEVPLMKRG
ncbi:unnamed protein product, partial [Effrenium voratum]